jgi:hypothetical protein
MLCHIIEGEKLLACISGVHVRESDGIDGTVAYMRPNNEQSVPLQSQKHS